MDYVRLGKTGMKVSKLCMGCMSFGKTQQGNQAWTLGEDDARPIFKQAIEAGINFFDTANIYSAGTSEEITGKLLKEFAPREEIVLATKIHGKMRPDANGLGQSRKAIMTEIDNSLRRLDTDYVDLYQIHRWDYNTPIEETLEALHDIVKAGKVRYIGASSMHAWQFAKALYTADLHGWTRFVSMQNHYNLIYREEEREMMKLCVDQNIGVIPWSPMAHGRVTRPWGEKGDSIRSKDSDFTSKLETPAQQSAKRVVDAIEKVAKDRGVPMSQIALAWQFTKPYVTSPIMGLSKQKHLDDALAACELKLTEEEIKAVEEPYLPHPIQGHA